MSTKKYTHNLKVAVVVQLLSHVQLFATAQTAAHQASLSFTVSQSLLKLMSIESVMPSNHFICCHPLLLVAFYLSQHLYLKVELFYMVGMFRNPSPGDSISLALRKLLKGGRMGIQATYKFAIKAAGSLNIKDQVSS